MEKYEIKWEKMSNGSNFYAMGCRDYLSSPMLMRLYAADSKICDVSYVEATFSGIEKTFTPIFRLIRSSKSTNYFYHVYGVYEEEIDKHGLPTILLRSGHWDKEEDYQQMAESSNKRNYLLSDHQLAVMNNFMYYNDVQELVILLKEFSMTCHNHLTLQECCRDNYKYKHAEFFISSYFVPWDLSLHWFLGTQKYAFIENWINKYIDCYEKMDLSKAIYPEEDVVVGYNRNIGDAFINAPSK